MKLKMIAAILVGSMSFTANADVFTGDGQVTNIRQSSSTTLQINHTAVNANSCATKTYAVAISTDHPNFKNLYAAILTAKALGSTTQFALHDNECIDGFGSVNIFTIK